MEKVTACCRSVLGGWQTEIVETGQLVGPVFNSVNDLWEWQSWNLPQVLSSAAVQSRENATRTVLTWY